MRLVLRGEIFLFVDKGYYRHRHRHRQTQTQTQAPAPAPAQTQTLTQTDTSTDTHTKLDTQRLHFLASLISFSLLAAGGL